MLTLEDRFWPKVDKRGPDECWLWTASTTTSGYGYISRGRRGEGKVHAHRVAYELLVGPIPEGLELDHLCRTRACVNPQHLEPVTHRENMRRGQLTPRRDVCGRGHPMTTGDPNVGFFPNGKRFCRTCKREMHRLAARRRRAEGGS